MADEDQVEDADALDDDESDGEGGKFGKKKLIIIAVAAVLLLGGGGGAMWFLDPLGLFGPSTDEEAAAAIVEAEPAVYYELPEMTVNLSAAERRAQYLRVRIALELSDQTMVEAIEPNLPRVLDAFQTYLRELRVSDLEGSAGIFRLKQELQRRVNLAIRPARVEAVLFREIIIQ